MQYAPSLTEGGPDSGVTEYVRVSVELDAVARIPMVAVLYTFELQKNL